MDFIPRFGFHDCSHFGVFMFSYLATDCRYWITFGTGNILFWHVLASHAVDAVINISTSTYQCNSLGLSILCDYNINHKLNVRALLYDSLGPAQNSWSFPVF